MRLEGRKLHHVIATLNLFQGKQSLSRRSKYGVSLITVLLFMLVATIAATATYKWITSEGHSSSSRMLEREAYQSSVAGIENTRAWMTYHANDVGALIKQYLKDDSHNPISLDGRLRTLTKPGQDYHVWLVGVNTETSTYKLKILSSGEARGGTRHSEVAILNVDGLYQVKVPQEKHHSNIDFEYAYFGGSFQSTQVTATSAIVNGNWSGNPPIVTGNWVVTGNATLSGNDVKVGETACIGGNASIQNTGFKGKDLYVVGDFSGNIEISGDAYIGGNITQGSAGNFTIGGSVTLDGKWTTSQGGKSVTIGGNLCTGENGQIYSSGTNHPFTVEGNVWMPGNYNVWTGWDNYSYYDKIILGNSSTSEVFIKTGHSWNDYNTMRNNKKFTEPDASHGGHPRKCISGYPHGWWTMYGPQSESTTPICDNYESGHSEWWSNETYQPYQNKASKNNLYYLYYMPAGVKDVDFGTYDDNYWKWCTKRLDYYGSYNFAGGVLKYCETYNSNTVMNSYFVNAPSNSSATSFTDSYHTNTDGNHPVNVSGNYYRYLNHDGSNITGSPYCKLASGKSWRPECGVTPWFKSNGTVSNNVTDERKFSCAETVKENCDEIWTPGTGCHGSSYQVPDVLVTAKDKFESYANKGCAASITSWTQSGFEKKLNDCFKENNDDEDKKKTNLYNGFLVVKITDSNPGQDYGQSSSNKLTGKFIIIVENKLSAGQNGIPMVNDGSFVFLYLKQGANYIQKEAKNYFIYTEGNIGESSGLHLTGTIYSPTTSCATANFKDATLTFSQEVIDELTSAAIICSNDGTPCGGATAGIPSTSTSEDSYTSGTDSNYISLAPQLGVSLESQYENNESLPSAANQAELNPSFIILPRVIYMPTDPYGELADYYNVVPLNGSSLKKADVTVNCASGIPTSGKLYPSGGTPLTEGIYVCEASATGYSKNPFWIVVKGSQRGTPTVSFVEDPQEMGTTGTAQVHATISAHDQPLTITVSCPARPEGWSYTPNNGSESGGKCTFEIPAHTGGTETIKLFDISTTNAVNGTLTFHLQAGEGYALTWPYDAELHVSSSATLKRIEATLAEINEYCTAHLGDCPEEGHRDSDWPPCSTTETWVEPVNVSFAVSTKNESWSVSIGGTGEMTLGARPSNDCVVIIPTENNAIDKLTMEANKKTYELRATAKAKKHTVKVAFTGDVGDGKNPVLKISVNGRESTCVYDDVKDKSPKACTVSVFSGEGVSISIDKDNEENKKFSYWKCDNNGGTTCPTIDPITSQNYSEFTVKDDNAVIYAHFNESDKHCFFDEFKNGSVGCYSGETEYCIDRCGNDVNSTCNGAVDANGVFTNSKWHLVEGSLASIDSYYGNISIDKADSKKRNRSGMEAVKVMSTVNAGLYGTLKALVQLPKATPSFGNASENIAKSGFMLRSNAAGSEYLMLNVYANQDGKLEVRLCRDGGTASCLQGNPVKNGNKASVGDSSMVMMAATLTDDNKLSVSAFVGNFYGSPDEYTYVFDLSGLSNNYGSRDHEFVGFSMADPNFKIYGIGWKSDDYDSECHDTYPTVKCSFAAVAPNGVVPTEENVKPWIGHSGWFDSKAYSCTESYYYYNGDDAGCGIAGESGVTCPSTGYKFSESGAGQHGYVENGKDMKTAKAWLKCSLSPEDGAWAVETEAERAHCGPFWTGKLTECTDHADLANVSAVSSGEEKTLSLAAVTNLRGSTLNVSMQNSDNNEIEIWLLSENANWGSDDFASRSVKFKGNGGSFEVTGSFADGAQGFDPEHVKQIVIKNHGGSSVTDVTITSACKNAVGISNCVAQYNDETGKWTITADVTNKDKVTAYSVEGTVDGSSVIGISDAPSWTPDQAKWEKTDNPYGNYQGKTFKFKASVTNQGGTVLSTNCNDVAITSVSCSNLSASDVESGAAWPQLSFKLNNCPNNKCVYTIKLDGTDAFSGQEGYGNVSKTPSGNSPECNTDGGCEHTYTVASANAEVPFNECSKTFKVKKKVTTEVTATCSVGGSLYQGQQLTLNVSNITNVPNLNNNVQMVWTFNGSSKTIDCGSSNCWNNTITAPAPGTYSYSLSYNGSPVEGCSGTVEIGSILTCSVSPTTVDKDGTYAFTANAAVGCSNCSFTDATGAVENNLSLQAGGSLTRNKTASSTGSKTLSFACNSCNNNVSTSCSASLTVNAVAPSFSCPTNQTETVSTSVSITPHNLTGCEDGCSYTISGTSITGNGYTGGALPGFVGPSSAGTVSYTVSLTNTAGTASHNCSITYNAATPVICHCADYCGSGCEDNIVTGNVFQNPFTGCIFVVSATRLDINQGYTVNGSTPSSGPLCYDNATNCSNALANYSAVDGGWYFYVVNKYTDVRSTGYNPCAPNVQPVLDDCPVVSTTVPPGSPVVITPALSTDCNTQNGCTYAISGDFSTTGSYRAGNIEFTDTGASNGSSRNYSLVISNSEGSSGACSIGPITYSAAASIEITKGDNDVSVPCGKTIHLTGTCNENTWGPFYLHVACSGQFTKTVGGVSAGQYNEVNYGAGNAYNGMDVNITTSCDPSPNTMSCRAWCDWNQ